MSRHPLIIRSALIIGDSSSVGFTIVVADPAVIMHAARHQGGARMVTTGRAGLTVGRVSG
jgi:hypothetical protein